MALSSSSSSVAFGRSWSSAMGKSSRPGSGGSSKGKMRPSRSTSPLTPTRFVLFILSTVLVALLQGAHAYRVNIRDTDAVREVCTGMFGGKEAYIELTFHSSASSGQVALVMYEWADVGYLGVETPDETGAVAGEELPRTYICTTAAIRAGLCGREDLGTFITSLPPAVPLNSTSIYTTAVGFSPDAESSSPTSDVPATPEDDDLEEVRPPPPSNDEPATDTRPPAGDEEENVPDYDPITGLPLGGLGDDATDTSNDRPPAGMTDEELFDEIEKEMEAEEELGEGRFKRQHLSKRGVSPLANVRIGLAGAQRYTRSIRRQDDQLDAIEMSIAPPTASDEGDDDDSVGEYLAPEVESPPPAAAAPIHRPSSGFGNNRRPATKQNTVATYDGPIMYAVPRTGYYCVGVVPVTLVESRRSERRAGAALPSASHAEYSGSILFRSTFDGELPAADYPKVGFYLFLSTVYAAVAIGWGILCFRFVRELLPMQYYISGTMAFLVVEMLANYGYYRYLNKHGGGTGSMAFLFVVAILNAGRNSISFFLLLIVSMGLSVVTPTLGPVMNRVRLLTVVHFVFGVLYSIGAVSVELETASLFLVLFLIFPLSLTLTAFLMWTILSLNGTITHLQARQQTYKLAMYQRLYRILVASVIAVAVFFVISSITLSGRLDEDYAPSHWRYRWILLDGSLSLIYLCAFVACAWIFRPTRDNVRFSMSQELAQEDQDADDYEMGPNGAAHQLGSDDEDGDDEPPAYKGGEDERLVKGEDGHGGETVFALDDEDEVGDIGGSGAEEFKRKMKADKAD